MQSIGRLFLAFVMSFLVSGMVAIQLAQMTRARQEFVIVLVALTLFLVVGIVVFAFGAAVSGQNSTLTVLALGLAGLIVAALAAVLALTHNSVSSNDMTTLGTFALCALVGLLIQWLMVRQLYS